MESLTVRGIVIPKVQLNKKELYEEALDYEPSDNDVILVSYPRTGTIFLSHIVQQILSNGEFLLDTQDNGVEFYDVIPFSFFLGTAGLDAITTKPRVYKHHFTLDKVKYNSKSKMIYIYRRPDDNVVSQYHLYKSYEFIQYNFNDYFENYLKGDVFFGGYFDHILSYWMLKDSEDVLFVSYEKLLLNKREEILRIARFLGDEFFTCLVNDESILKKIIEKTNFECMKNNYKNFTFEGKKNTFFRKGRSGDGELTLSEDQRQRLRDRAKEKLHGIELISEWYPEEE